MAILLHQSKNGPGLKQRAALVQQMQPLEPGLDSILGARVDVANCGKGRGPERARSGCVMHTLGIFHPPVLHKVFDRQPRRICKAFPQKEKP